MHRLIVLLAMLCVLTGCNTMAGFGKDMKKVGQKIESSAQK